MKSAIEWERERWSAKLDKEEKAHEVTREALDKAREDIMEARAWLAETRAKLAELREMERERNMYRHAFDRLAGHVMGTILPSDGTAEVESLIKSCEAHLDRLRRKASLASKVCEFVREYERRAK